MLRIVIISIYSSWWTAFSNPEAQPATATHSETISQTAAAVHSKQGHLMCWDCKAQSGQWKDFCNLTDSWGLTGWFCAAGIFLRKMIFQKGRNETFSFLILPQKNVCSRGYALSYGITAHFFRVSAAFVILLYSPCQPEQFPYWDTWLYAVLNTEMCHLHSCVENSLV